MSDLSGDDGFSVVTEDNISQEEGSAVIKGLETNKKYWFKLIVSGSIREGESNIVGFTIPELTISMDGVDPMEDMQPMVLQLNGNTGVEVYGERTFIINTQNTAVSIVITDEFIANPFYNQNLIKVLAVNPGTIIATITIKKEGYITVIKKLKITVEPFLP